MTSMSSKYEPVIRSHDTGQQIPCFDRCQLTITWMSKKKLAVIQGCMSLSTYQLEYGCHLVQLRCQLQKYMTTISSKYEPTIWSHDTGQQIPCCDRCQLTMTWISKIKEVGSKPRLHVSVNLHVSARVWPPFCTTLQGSKFTFMPSCPWGNHKTWFGCP